MSVVLYGAAGCTGTIRRKGKLKRKLWISEETWDVIRRAEAKVKSEMHNNSD